MQGALTLLSSKGRRSYVIKADVADCFGSINQHTLVNYLESSGYPTTLKRALEICSYLILGTGALVDCSKVCFLLTSSAIFI